MDLGNYGRRADNNRARHEPNDSCLPPVLVKPEAGQARIKALDSDSRHPVRLPRGSVQPQPARVLRLAADQVPLGPIVAIAKLCVPIPRPWYCSPSQEPVLTSRMAAKSRAPIPCVPTTMPSTTATRFRLQLAGRHDAQDHQ
jgi:hypothetical protein